MGWFDGAQTEENLFRMSVGGERIYAPVGARGPLYLVSDAAATRIQGDSRWYFRHVFLVATVLLTVAQRQWGWVFVLPPAAVGVLGLRWWLARGLPRAMYRASDLQPVNWHAKYLAVAQATGRPTLWLMLLSAILMAIVGAAGGAYLRIAAGWLLSALMLLCAVFYGWQLWLLKRGAACNPHSAA
jgi:hypothetical protein